MRILVTGASGFIGRHLIDALNKTEHEVFAISRRLMIEGFWATKHVDYPNIHLYCINLANREECKKLPKDIDVVYHLASQQPNSEELTFEDYLRGNVLTTKNIVDFYKNPKTKIIYLSSSRAKQKYGYYGWSKWFGEQLIKTRLNTVILRFPMILAKNCNNLISYIYHQAKTNKPIEIYHKNHHKVFRDFIHISEVIKICKKFLSVRISKRYYFGCRDTMELREVALYLINKLNSTSEIIIRRDKESFAEGFMCNMNYYLTTSNGFDILDKYIEEMEHND